ncbi:7,8 dihydropteroate synthase (methanopterin) [hydrocarbon metagenome]|uniref:7,8 dihydropteroate synthase (Methanopterin) n=1 Tax=hydrocarbon metagenome TaxID=938273 RepID=A0A0W8FIB0_9ZZZZ
MQGNGQLSSIVMKLTVLVDNNTLIDRYFSGEPGLSLYIEEGGRSVLFDTGYSDLFVTNARKMGIDLLHIDAVVLSHGHIDHTGGLGPLIRQYTEAEYEGRQYFSPEFIAHPDVLLTRTRGNFRELGSQIAEEKLSRHGRIAFTRTPVWLTENLVFLGEIQRRFGFEAVDPRAAIVTESGEEADALRDDTALACRTDEGLVIITGCSHAGICSIIEQAKDICGDDRIVDVIGGFHLYRATEEHLAGTVEYFRTLGPDAVHACHCTGLRAQIALADAVPIQETGVGLMLEYG